MILGIIHKFPYFSGINPAQAENAIFIFWCFRDPNEVQMTCNFRSINIWKEEDLGAKEANKRRFDGQKGEAHAAKTLGRVGPTFWSLDAPLPSIFSPTTPSWPKTDYKNSPRGFSERRAAETQKHRNRDQELQIGGGKSPAGRCRRGLHLLQRLLHRIHDEEGVVHPWTMGLWK